MTMVLEALLVREELHRLLVSESSSFAILDGQNAAAILSSRYNAKWHVKVGRKQDLLRLRSTGALIAAIRCHFSNLNPQLGCSGSKFHYWEDRNVFENGTLLHGHLDFACLLAFWVTENSRLDCS